MGIPPDRLDDIFEMFSQLNREAERRHGGLGIGLHLVKRLAQMHGGSVEAHSDGTGTGSRFIVRLPLPAQPIQPPRPAPEDDSSIQGWRVLVVDDNPDAAKSLAMLLELSGNDVQVAHDGAAAVARVDAFMPDLILMDIGMPTMNGYDACHAIRQKPGGKQIKMLALTGWGQETDRLRSSEAGFDAHLVKPVDIDALKSLLKESASKSQKVSGSL
jgi:CheY-like chemotaxis protein